MDIFDEFTAAELRETWREPTESWPDDFCEYVNNLFASSLLDRWLENHTDDEYREEIRQYVEDLTYGYTDDDGNVFYELKEDVEEDGQMRLF